MPTLTKARNAYDEMPYSAKPFPQTHPDRLATIATLFGMTPPPVERCRVLEIGCGRGGNLIPMAEQLPDSTFVGIDLSEVQTREAQFLASSLGLANANFRHMDLLDVDPAFGEFDYIICHGVFSWVPQAVQEKIFSICAEHLAPQGVAYVSYNVHPGWRMRSMIREMMCYHTRSMHDATGRVSQARALLDFLAQYTNGSSPYGAFLRSELGVLRGHEDAYLFHEHLEDVNEPLYFFEFAERMRAHHLQYLGEADIATMYAGHLQPEVRAALERVATDWIQMEQYMDFLRNRMFRQTLLCHENISLDRELKPALLDGLHVAACLIPEEKRVDVRSAEPLRFKHTDTDRVVTSAVPVMKAAILRLTSQWPRSIPFSELFRDAYATVHRERISGAQNFEQAKYLMGRTLFELYLSGMIELHSQIPKFVRQPGEKPIASKLSRYQVRSTNVVTNLRHETISMGEVARHLIPSMDGSRDLEDLMDVLGKLVSDGTLVVPGVEPSGLLGSAARKLLGDALRSTLAQVAKSALLTDYSIGS